MERKEKKPENSDKIQVIDIVILSLETSRDHYRFLKSTTKLTIAGSSDKNEICKLLML